MIPNFPLCSSDRLLVLAPHPDDESIGAGGLLQHARGAGAAVRILFATNGDNNPWPQRVIEKRWRIRPEERVRWGARRRREAVAALAVLGLSEQTAGFFNLPDQGVTALLMNGGESVLTMLEDELKRFQPTIVVGPSGDDVHPDHSALHVLMSFALQETGFDQCQRYDFLVHAPAHVKKKRGIARELSVAEMACKLAAIRSHWSQVFLSGRRFGAYATRHEWFRACPVAEQSISPATCRPTWRLQVPVPEDAGRPVQLLIAGSSEGGEPLRWSLKVPRRSRLVHPRDERTGAYQRAVAVRVSEGFLQLTIPARLAHPSRPTFAKITASTYFYDRTGWECLSPVHPAPAPHAAPRRIAEMSPEEYALTGTPGNGRPVFSPEY